MKSKYKTALKAAGSLILLFVLIRQINIFKLMETLKGASFHLVILAIGASFFRIFLISVGWKKILKVSFEKSYKFILSLIAINTVVPMKAGRIGAPVLLKKIIPDINKERSIGATFFATIIYTFLYGVFTILGVFLIGLPSSILPAAILASGLYIGASLLMIQLGSNGMSHPWIEKLIQFLPNKLKFEGKSVEKNLKEIATVENTGFYSFFWILSFLPVQGLRLYLIFASLGYTFSNPLILLLLPVLAYSVTVIPISLGGVGLAEFSAYSIFVFMGVPSSIAISVAFLDRFITAYLPAMVGSSLIAKTG